MKKENIKTYFTSESVTEGHPDKVCDKISDSILDGYLSVDKDAHVACEVVATANYVAILGEVKSKKQIDVASIVREAIKEIGYVDDDTNFNYQTVEIVNKLNEQSADIDMGVLDDQGAGDQGMMFGFACCETPEYMPAPIAFAHRITKRLSEVRKKDSNSILKPDGKSQVTVEYLNGMVNKITNIVVSVQHSKEAKLNDIKKLVISSIEEVIPNQLLKDTKYHINETGRFYIGGPAGDTGLTGRKIIVDTYGGYARHGGGAFSGKDPSKVDRSAAYMARYISKNIVAAIKCNKIEIGLSYSIAVSEPTSIMINTYGEDIGYTHDEINNMIKEVFKLTPKGIISTFNLRTPLYKKTTNYGHFGKDELPWEKLDKVKAIKEYFKKRQGN